MAEWLRRLTRNQMGSSCASSNLADCEIFLAPLFIKSNREKVRNKEKQVIPRESEKKSNMTVQEAMTDVKKSRESTLQSWQSAQGMRIEIRWVRPAQVWIFLSLDIFGPRYLIYQPIESSK